jgi:hypothetical protein
MGRKQIIQNVFGGINQKIVPFIIETLYSENPDDLIFPAENVKLALNKLSITNTLKRLKVTAA